MKIKTSELTGAALDWAVAKCEVTPVKRHNTGAMYLIDTPWVDKTRVKWIAEYSPSRHWAQGGPIIEREGITIQRVSDALWDAFISRVHHADGPTPLIAAMRCYVASKLGDEVEIPDELV